jgi:hypothetical protein
MSPILRMPEHMRLRHALPVLFRGCPAIRAANQPYAAV